MRNHHCLVPSLGTWAGGSSVEGFSGNPTCPGLCVKGLGQEGVVLSCARLVLEKSEAEAMLSSGDRIPPKVSNGEGNQ